jgi:hypothetical protein
MTREEKAAAIKEVLASVMDEAVMIANRAMDLKHCLPAHLANYSSSEFIRLMKNSEDTVLKLGPQSLRAELNKYFDILMESTED